MDDGMVSDQFFLLCNQLQIVVHDQFTAEDISADWNLEQSACCQLLLVSRSQSSTTEISTPNFKSRQH